MIETIEIYVTVQPKRKQYRLAETIPFSNQFWRSGQQTQHFCWICGVVPTKSGQVCVYCQRQFPIKKS